MKALTQSYSRTKAKDYKSFKQTMELHTNSSNNTIFADAQGNIAYFHANFIPKRDTKFDWTKPVDGSDPATDWHGLLVASTSRRSCSIRRAAGCTTSTTGRGPRRARAARSTRTFRRTSRSGREESPRGLSRDPRLQDKKDFTLETLIAPRTTAICLRSRRMIPPLIKAYDERRRPIH